MTMKRVTERIKHQMRASWRKMLCSMLRISYRLQDRIEERLIKPQEAQPSPKPTGSLVGCFRFNPNTHQVPAMTAVRIDSRRMVRTTLMGSHVHQTATGQTVHVWQRDGKYLARGRWQGHSFGETLGYDPIKASARLRKLLGEIEDGSFIRRSEKVKQPEVVVEQPITLRQLVQAFLIRKRAERGEQTAANYRARLKPALLFCEQPENQLRWPWAKALNREFVVELKSFLLSSTTTRNGRKSGVPRLISGTQVRHCLESIRTLINWACDPMVGKLPTQMVNPVNQRILPLKSHKNPLRPCRFTLEELQRLADGMDHWQICHFAWSLVLPLRPDEAVGLLVSDVNRSRGWFEFGYRFADSNFTKAKTQFVLPYPPEFLPLLTMCLQTRSSGPLLRSRRAIASNAASPTSDDELHESYEHIVRDTRSNVQAEHDRKLLFRRLLKQRWGGLSEDRLALEMKSVMAATLQRSDLKLYDLRHHVTQMMKDAGLPHLELRYLTGHACRDILHEYSAVKPTEAMAHYFASIRPLIQSVMNRAAELGIT
jgi:integrase